MTTLAQMVTGFVLSVPSMVVDVNPFIEEMCQEGVAGWNVGPVEAMVLQVVSMHPPTAFTILKTSSRPLKLGNLHPVACLASLGSQKLGLP